MFCEFTHIFLFCFRHWKCTLIRKWTGCTSTLYCSKLIQILHLFHRRHNQPWQVHQIRFLKWFKVAWPSLVWWSQNFWLSSHEISSRFLFFIVSIQNEVAGFGVNSFLRNFLEHCCRIFSIIRDSELNWTRSDLIVVFYIVNSLIKLKFTECDEHGHCTEVCDYEDFKLPPGSADSNNTKCIAVFCSADFTITVHTCHKEEDSSCSYTHNYNKPFPECCNQFCSSITQLHWNT